MVLKKILNTFIKVFLPLILGCGLLWYLYRDNDFQDFGQRMQKYDIRYGVLLLSLIFGLVANIVRSYRWGILIDTLGERYKMKNLVFAVLGNYALNYVFPRVGEIWRCGIITKYEKISFTKLLGTLVIDRVADTVFVGLLAQIVFSFNFGFFKNFLANNPDLVVSFPAYWLIVIVVIVVAAVWYTFTRLSHLTVVQKAKGVLANVWEGIKSVWRMERKVLFILQTIMIWGLYFIYFYITFYAFGFTEDKGINVGLLAFTMSSIGVAVPVQGGIGVWHFMVITTLLYFNVDKTEAKDFAFIVYAVQNIWVALCGLAGIIALPIFNKDKEV
jgi:uncharacterized protein (TIRG00374 family)